LVRDYRPVTDLVAGNESLRYKYNRKLIRKACGLIMIKKYFKYVLFILVLGSGCFPGLVQAQLLPEIFLDLHLVGLQFPVAITHAGDGSGRQFILEQQGRIKVFQNGALLNPAFLDLSLKVRSDGERGLLGLAFPPGFNLKQYFYVYYTSLTGDNVLARYFVSADPNLANPDSEQILLTFPHAAFSNHNGGQLAFGPNDGFLYISTGDGGSAGDPFNNAQNPQSLLGKILRIDSETPPAPGNSYVIPLSNPFLGVAGFRPEIWALGLRNPWRFSFDRLTGDLFIGDVGQNNFEEVDFQPAGSAGGENYGWKILEGPACFSPPNCGFPAGNVLPVMFYDHTEGIAVIGGYVYRGTKFGPIGGVYFFGDLTGKIWGLRQEGGVWQRQLLANPGFSITAFGEDEAGNLYVADYQTGNIFEIKVTTVVDATVLWTRSDIGSAALWQINPSLPTGLSQITGGGFLFSVAGVGAPWQATSYAHVSATEAYVLWTRSDIGGAALWQVNPSLPTGPGQITGGGFLFSVAGVGAPWQATSYAHVSATEAYVLWTRSDIGGAALWRVNPSLPTGPGQITGGGFLFSVAGVGAPWQATSYAHVSATDAYVLWTRNDNGSAALWQIDPSLPTGPGQIKRSVFLFSAFGVGPPWQATSYAHVSATEAYVLWTRSDNGSAVLWQIDPSLPTGPGQIKRSVFLFSASGVGPPWQATSISIPGVP
jgi:glucose/arabinose dehydrogenase